MSEHQIVLAVAGEPTSDGATFTRSELRQRAADSPAEFEFDESTGALLTRTRPSGCEKSRRRRDCAHSFPSPAAIELNNLLEPKLVPPLWPVKFIVRDDISPDNIFLNDEPATFDFTTRWGRSPLYQLINALLLFRDFPPPSITAEIAPGARW